MPSQRVKLFLFCKKFLKVQNPDFCNQLKPHFRPRPPPYTLNILFYFDLKNGLFSYISACTYAREKGKSTVNILRISRVSIFSGFEEYINYQKFRTFLISDKTLSEIKNVRNFWCPKFKSVRNLSRPYFLGFFL